MAEPSYDVIKMTALFYFIENLPCLIVFYPPGSSLHPYSDGDGIFG